MKQVIQHQTWNETAQSWTDVTSEVEVLDAASAAALETRNLCEYLASCTAEERAEYATMFPTQYARARLAAWTTPHGDTLDD